MQQWKIDVYSNIATMEKEMNDLCKSGWSIHMIQYTPSEDEPYSFTIFYEKAAGSNGGQRVFAVGGGD